MVAVSGYSKRDGTKVRAHSRDWPGAGRELGILGSVAAVVVLLSFGGGTSGSGAEGSRPGKEPREGSPVVRIVFPTGTPPAADPSELEARR